MDFKLIITVAITNSVVLGTIMTLVSNLLLKKYELRWKERADSNLAVIQSELMRHNTSLNTITNLQGSNYQQAQNKRIEAITVLWDKILGYQDVVPPMGSFIYNVLSKKEIEDLWDDSKQNSDFIPNRDLLKRVHRDTHLTEHINYLKEVEKMRPFLGEEIWSLFALYRTFLGRISVLLLDSVKSKKLFHWHEDGLLKQLFKEKLTKEEYDFIYNLKIHSLDITTKLIENKLLFEINKNLSGEILSQSALERLKETEEYLSTMKANNKTS